MGFRAFANCVQKCTDNGHSTCVCLCSSSTSSEAIVEARKLEHAYPHARKIKHMGSCHSSS